jgi:maltooligosyltrehalose trehalohydrolase
MGVATPAARRQGATNPWRPSLGGIVEAGGAWFRVWAPAARRLDVVVARTKAETASEPGEIYPLSREAEGVFAGRLGGMSPGTCYWYRVNQDRLLPDPASRFQPQGVHGPSALVDPGSFRWTDAAWRGLREEQTVIYELHVGAFTPEGTFAGVESRLDHLASLGVTALELMPVAEFPGRWNWGYDGVDLFAPCHRYGTPDDLRRLVDAAHRRGLGVILDVVYNHLGPDGAYLSAFSPHYFTNRHKSPWGDGVNLDGPHSEHVRGFFIENALHWVHEYHVDGLRLDATHALEDDGPEHFLSELSRRVEDQSDRPILLIAEDERNLDRLVRERQGGGFRLAGVWSDDFHHQVRRLLAGDSEGYYANFSGTTADLAETIRQGWFFVGQWASHTGRPRGTNPSGIPLHRFVACLQNHDQVGNRAHGDRLHHVIGLAEYRAASALLLFVPETPLLFMGQEWAASTPFLYFTDHHEELGRAVTEGRRAEFAAFSAFAHRAERDRIPDPQEERTFERSRLAWAESDVMPHAGVLRLYREFLRSRRSLPASAGDQADLGTGLRAEALDENTLGVRRPGRDHEALLLVVRLRGSGTTRVTGRLVAGAAWQTMLTTEDASFAADGRVPNVKAGHERVDVTFGGPAAVLLHG